MELTIGLFLKNKIIFTFDEAREFIELCQDYPTFQCDEDRNYFLNPSNIETWLSHDIKEDRDPHKSTFYLDQPEWFLLKDNKLNRKLYPNNKTFKGYILKEEK